MPHRYRTHKLSRLKLELAKKQRKIKEILPDGRLEHLHKQIEDLKSRIETEEVNKASQEAEAA